MHTPNVFTLEQQNLPGKALHQVGEKVSIIICHLQTLYSQLWDYL